MQKRSHVGAKQLSKGVTVGRDSRPRESTLRRETARFWLAAALLIVAVLAIQVPEALAWHVEDQAPTGKDYLYQLLRSRFGTLVMVFCGLGGFATLYMQREGKKGQQVPVMGIAMLLIAILMFIARTMVTSGLLGAQYLDYGR